MKPLTPATPRAIIMVGIPGAGKTAFAERFAKTFQAPFVNQRALQYTLDIDAATATKVAAHMLDELIKTNRTLIYEGPTASKVNRTAVMKHVRAGGYEPLIVWVQTESLEAKRRATKKQSDGSEITDEGFDDAIKRFTPPTAQEKPIVISGKHTYASQLKIVLKRLAGEQRPTSDTSPEPPRIRSSRNIILR